MAFVCPFVISAYTAAPLTCVQSGHLLELMWPKTPRRQGPRRLPDRHRAGVQTPVGSFASSVPMSFAPYHQPQPLVLPASVWDRDREAEAQGGRGQSPNGGPGPPPKGWRVGAGGAETKGSPFVCTIQSPRSAWNKRASLCCSLWATGETFSISRSPACEVW